MNRSFFFATKLLVVLLIFAPQTVLFAQQKAGSFLKSGEKKSSLVQVSDLNAIADQWMFNVRNVDIAHPASAVMDSLKQLQMKKKLLWEDSATPPAGQGQLSKTDAAMPLKGTEFLANFPDGAVPNDNSIAISNAGTIVSAVNSNISMYTAAGAHLKTVTMFDFAQNSSLSGISFDPRVQYDPEADRFIIVYLNGITSATSKVVVGFSKTNNPAGAWNIYFLDGDATASNFWVDYPNIAITKKELIITGSLFDNDKYYQEPVIWQIEKQSGYDGATLNFQQWTNIIDEFGYTPFTLVPMSSGNSTHTGPNIYLVSNEGPGGDRINLYEITNELSAPNETMDITSIASQDYSVAGSARMKNTTITLNTGDCRVKNGFILNGYIHYVYSSNFSNGFSGVNYGRIKLSSKTVQMRSFGTNGLDYCYPSVAWFGTELTDKSVVINFLSSGLTIFPEMRAVNCDDNMHLSTQQLIKAGDNYFQVITGEQRWGDYTGIASRFNSLTPEVWVAGGFPQSSRKYGNWISKLTPGVPTAIKETEKEFTGIEIFPNPAVKMFNLKFNMHSSEQVVISLHDLNGRLVKTFYRDKLKAGANLLNFNEDILSTGVYYLRIENSSCVLFTEKLVIQ